MTILFLIEAIIIIILLYYILRQKRSKQYYCENIKTIIENIKADEFETKNSNLVDLDFEQKELLDYYIREREKSKQSIQEVERYKEELNTTYKSLLSKSTELEYSNSLLEKKLANMSTMNAIGKSVLSEFDLQKIISIILDAYIVLVGVKKISLYLWEEKKLVNVANKGDVIYDPSNEKTSNENIRGIKKSKIREEYLEIARNIKGESEEVLISEIKVKGKELGAVFLIEDLLDGKSKDVDVETASALALYVAIAINNYIIYVELAEKERIEQEVSIAAEIQKSLVPQDLKNAFGFEISNYFEPAREVGGDYYDYFISAEGKFGISIGDVSGKGIPAALLMATIRAVLKTLAVYEQLPHEALTRLNEIIIPNINEEMFVTLFYSVFDLQEKKLYYSNAGHNPFIWYNKKEDKLEQVRIKGVAVGFLENYVYSLGELKLGYEDILVFYTDGITEAENPRQELFGIDRLKEVISKNKTNSADGIKEAILNAVNIFREGYQQVDDITLVVIKHKR